MVESRLRTLVQDLENTDNILTAHPGVKGISANFICLTEEEQAAASQGELSPDAMKRSEEEFAGKGTKVYTKNFFIGLEIEKKPSECGDALSMWRRFDVPRNGAKSATG
jgi:poly(A) polymerase